MKKLHLTLHYIVFTLIIVVVIFFIYYIYDKFKIKEAPQYIEQERNVIHDEVQKTTKETTEEEKPEVIKPKVEKIVKPKVEKIVKPKVEKIVKPKIEKIVKPKIEKIVKPKVEKIVKPKIAKAVPKIEKIIKPVIQKSYDAKVLYLQNCKLCHGTIKTFAKKVTKNRINKVFTQNAKELSLIHEKSNVSKITDKYFKSKEYELQIESIIKYITKEGKI
ncbi:MAG: hypothetical protein L3I99_08210 [Sulfurimonas sp.]|nr:hypothetical protein [Sulfurimonas sp.]